MNDPSNKYPNPGYAWYMVVLLTVAYILSFVDRYILGLLVEPIQADLGISDRSMGWLLGPAFAVFYATMGLPLGLLADRKRRTWIVAIGIAVWSFATAASGLAKNFVHLLIARMSVGVGEATLSPCAMSMISDSFPPQRRGKPIGFYTMALSLGAGIASLVSASVLAWTESVQEVSLPIVGVMAPWQFTFIVVGLPGLIMALLFLTLREPKRQEVTAITGSDNANLWDMLKYVGSRWKVYGSFISFVCLMIIVAYSHGWLAAMFKRTWGWEAKEYATVNAIVLLAIGPLTVNFAGWASDKLFNKGRKDAPLVILMIGAAIIVPTGFLFPLMPNVTLAWVVYSINLFGIALASATGVTALLNITPGEIKGQTVAFYYMVMSMAGLILGPLTVGYLSDLVFGNEKLNYAVAAVPLIFGLPVLLLIPFARRAYLNEFESLEKRRAEVQANSA